MNDKERELDEHLGRFPAESEYIRRIDDISNAIRNGSDGYIETQNLIYDLPISWLADIKQDADDGVVGLASIEVEYVQKMKQNVAPSQKIKYGREYSLKVKQRIISYLYKIGIWFPTRQKVPESEFMDMHEQNEK